MIYKRKGLAGKILNKQKCMKLIMYIDRKNLTEKGNKVRDMVEAMK